MGAVGTDYFVELINSAIAVYQKSDGVRIDEPMVSGRFFRITTNVPANPYMLDPRILYDAAAGRWVACALDIGTTPVSVILAVSGGANPLPLTSDNWTKHLVPLHSVTNSESQLDNADYVTLGLDANGVYLSVVYRSAKSNDVLAIHKTFLYGNPSTLPTSSLLPITSIADISTIIQPAVNFDVVATNASAWLVAKGPAHTNSPYQGGAVWYRRVVWNQTTNGPTPNWVADWREVEQDSEKPYRDYFDFGDTFHTNANKISAPQKGGLQGVSLGAGLDGASGSRLMTAMIRDGFLWTCQHVGLDGADGVYSNDASGLTVDRSAIQWLQLAVNTQQSTLSWTTHGRIYDSGAEPFWFYCPSLMVNTNGDMVIGFSGSAEHAHIGAFYSWQKVGTSPPEQEGVIKFGEASYDWVQQ